MKKIEFILVAILVVSLIARDAIPEIQFEKPLLVAGSLLALLYLIGFWWLQKPALTNFRTIFVTIFYGITFCSWAFTVQFIALYLTGDEEMVIFSGILTAVALLLDLASSIGKIKVLTSTIVARLSAFAVVCCILIMIPERIRVQYTYRNDPEFIRFYNEHVEELEYMDRIKDAYQMRQR